MLGWREEANGSGQLNLEDRLDHKYMAAISPTEEEEPSLERSVERYLKDQGSLSGAVVASVTTGVVEPGSVRRPGFCARGLCFADDRVFPLTSDDVSGI